MVILPMLFGVFQPPRPAPGGPAYGFFPCGLRTSKSCCGDSSSKSSEQHRNISTAEVLRLRATSAVSRDQSVRRCAQDDESVGELTERRPLCGSRGEPQILGFGPKEQPTWGPKRR